GCDVFMDVHKFDNRDAVDLSQIDAHVHFVVLLTPGLIEPFQDADDPTRREIEYAISRRRSIIPLLTNGFSFTPTILPSKISVLRRHYGLTITPETLAEDVATLHERLANAHFFGTVVSTPPEDAATVAARRDDAEQQPLPTDDQLSAETLFNRALTRARQDHAAKRADYDEVLRLDPAHVYARFERALERRRSSDESGAFEDYSEILRLNPQFYKANNNRAELYFTRGQFERALADYEQATTLRPDYTMALTGKALTLHALGRVDEALRLWKPLLAKDERFYDAGWVGREFRLPAAMIDELHRLNTHLHALSHASDD
ncbi:MAG: tetratricopeptide repeat protein, partial [Chloroflexota bacterium]